MYQLHNLIQKSVVARPGAQIPRKKHVVPTGQEDEAAIAAFFTEVRRKSSTIRIIRKRSGADEQDAIMRPGPDVINTFHCYILIAEEK